MHRIESLLIASSLKKMHADYCIQNAIATPKIPTMKVIIMLSHCLKNHVTFISIRLYKCIYCLVGFNELVKRQCSILNFLDALLIVKVLLMCRKTIECESR